MIRAILAALIVIATVAPSWAFPKAKDGVVTLGFQPGGYVHKHIREAQEWRLRNYRVVIRGDQYSAAAMMVLYFHIKGGKVCAKKGADLYFHGLANAKTGKPVPYRAKFIFLFGKKYTDMIGPVPQRGFKRIAPSYFGIPACSK